MGEDSGEWLVQELEKEANEIEEIYTNGKVPMKELSPKKKTKYYYAKECHICNGNKFKGFVKYCTKHKCKFGKCEKCEEKKQCVGCNYYQFKNHNHITGKFIAAAHSYFNINYWRLSKQTPIPVIFHNLKGYDAHHIIGSLYNIKNVKVGDVIAESAEKYKSFVNREKRIKQVKEIQKKRTS